MLSKNIENGLIIAVTAGTVTLFCVSLYSVRKTNIKNTVAKSNCVFFI